MIICALFGGAALTGLAAESVFTPWSVAQTLIAAPGVPLPAELSSPDQHRWDAWAKKHDRDIRARLEQGDVDSVVNLLLFGTSFTKQPRIRVETIGEASRTGVLRARVDDLVAGLQRPGDNERLIFASALLRRRGIDPAAPGEAGVFLFNHLQRVLQERKTIAERAAATGPASSLDRLSLFRERGVSLDTSILPDYSIEQALLDLKNRGVLREGQVARAAVIGPGLDFADKNEESAFDYYPQQTIQPFAFYDSLVRLKLAKTGGLSVSVLDISSRVIEHLERARASAKKGAGYVVQLPRDISRPWPQGLITYWQSFGAAVGTAVAPIRPPQIFQGLETRAVRIRPDVVLACQPVDVDIVVSRLGLAAEDRFDLIIGTNIFLYYDSFEQTLALENAGSMLKSGGLLLTNDKLPESLTGSMRQAGTSNVVYDTHDPRAHETVGWYRKTS